MGEKDERKQKMARQGYQPGQRFGMVGEKSEVKKNKKKKERKTKAKKKRMQIRFDFRIK